MTLFDARLPPFSGFTVCLSLLRWPDRSMVPTDTKASCLYHNFAKALREAQKRGFENAVICDRDGNVAEFASANIFLVTIDGAVVTPIANGRFLSGITRARVIALLSADGIKVDERARWQLTNC